VSTEEPDRRATPDDGTDASVDPRVDEQGGVPPERPRRSYGKLLVFGLPVLLLALIGWNKAAQSDTLCTSCHVNDAAAISAERSIHQDVPCLSCHQGSGLMGSLAYLPTLAREGVHSVIGAGAGGVLEARSCSDCHPDLSPAAHEGVKDDCVECHGDPSHPELQVGGAQAMLLEEERHPAGFIQTHGRFVEERPSSCVECHEAKFCEACHLKETFPHPDGWISTHGPAQEEDEDACTLCHGPTFCAGCHGTEIPHRADWLGRHDTALEDASTIPCMTCHPETDCTVCHSEHNVHVEQGLFSGPPVAIPSEGPDPTPSPSTGTGL
jgi:hypothetical protein